MKSILNLSKKHLISGVLVLGLATASVASAVTPPETSNTNLSPVKSVSVKAEPLESSGPESPEAQPTATDLSSDTSISPAVEPVEATSFNEQPSNSTPETQPPEAPVVTALTSEYVGNGKCLVTYSDGSTAELATSVNSSYYKGVVTTHDNCASFVGTVR